jgi:type II secretory pathway pseudopilin PulG
MLPLIGGLIAGGASLISGLIQGGAQRRAANAQARAAQAGIDEQRRQFDAVQKLLAPYVSAGNDALSNQRDILGLNGPEAQQKAIAGLRDSPEFRAMVEQGETGILQNASATGGLRGGNVQTALAKFRPQVLTELINQRFARLGGLTTLGQNSAAGVGAAGQGMAGQVAGLLGDQGEARAAGILGQGAMWNAIPNALMGGLGTYGGLGGFTTMPGSGRF